MSEPYELYVILRQPAGAESAVMEAHRILSEAGAEWDEDSRVHRLATQSEDPEPEPIHDTTGLKRFATWPSLGSVDYMVTGVPVGVYFHAGPSESTVDSIVLTIGQRVFESRERELLPVMKRLAEDFHDVFHAKRTLMGWGLDVRGFDLEAERDRLRQDRFEGVYEIIDLQRPDA